MPRSERQPTHYSRRDFLRFSAAIALHLAEVNQPKPIEIGPGTLTVFNSDRLMELQVLYRTGTQGDWVFQDNDFQKSILAAQSLTDLTRVSGLIENKKMFEAAADYNPNLLTAMQQTILTKRMIAVDAHRFGVPGVKLAAGFTFQLTISEALSDGGHIIQLSQPQTVDCYNWDVLHYNSGNRFFADTNPFLYESELNAIWNSDRQRFLSKSATVVSQLPQVTLRFDQNTQLP